MKKETIKTIATATAVVSATALTVNAKADSVTNNPTTENNDKVQTTVTPKQQLQNNVDTTKQALDSANQTQTQAQSQADKANNDLANNQAQVNDAQKALDQAKANDQANADALSKTQAQITDQTKVVNDNKQSLDTAQKALDQAKSNQAQAQTSVDKQKQTVANAQSEVDKTNATDLSNKLNQANSAVTNDNQAISNAQKTLDQAKANDAQNAKQVADKQNELTDAQKALNNAVKANQNSQADLTSAKNNQASVQADLDAKQKEVNDIKSQMGNVNTIIVPKGYTLDKVKQAYADAKKGDTSFAENFYNTVGKNGMTINEYKANAKDIAETVDLKNITPEQQLEINKFAVGLINQVREQLGLQKIILNQSSMNVAKEVVAGYTEQGEISKFLHDVPHVLDPVAQKYGLDGLAENRSWNYYDKTISLGSTKGNEDYYTDYDNDNYVNMAVVKSDIYSDILQMLFEDNFDTNTAYGHAANFLTSDDITDYKDTSGNVLIVPLKAFYMGIGITNDNNYQKFLSSFYELIPVYEPTTLHDVQLGNFTTDLLYSGLNSQSSTFAYGSSINADTPNYAQQLKQATDELSAKQTALDEAKQVTAQAQAKADKANQDLANAQSALAKLQANLLNLQAYKPQRVQAQNALTKANQKLADDNKKSSDLVVALQNLAETRSQRQATLDQAKADLATKQKALDGAKAVATSAQAKLNSDKQTLAKLQSDLTQAQTNLDNAKQALVDLQNLPERLAKAKADFEKAQADLTSAQAKLDEAKKALAESQANADVANETLNQANDDKNQAQTAYDKAMKAYNDYLAAEQAVKDAEEKAKAQAQAKAEHTYFAQTANGKVVDEKGHIMVGYTVKGNQVFDAQGKLVGTLAQTSTTRRMANTVKQENAKALPQTGDKQNSNTTVGAILVGLGSLLGLGALGKRKED